MAEIAERPERESVTHDVFDDRSSSTVVESVGVPPGATGAVQLLVYEPGGRLPARDTRPPAQRNPEQAEPVVDQGSLSHRDGQRREDPEAKFRRGDALQVDCVGEKGEYSLARQPHGCPENVKRHKSHCNQPCHPTTVVVLERDIAPTRCGQYRIARDPTPTRAPHSTRANLAQPRKQNCR